jgi:hypothetical protein
MEAVWSDMKHTQLPSWVGSVPSNWGMPKRGKLTANHWQVICMIHLPITLIRLWDGDTGRRQELLKHFMDLVTAVKIANMCISTRSQVESYNTHMFLDCKNYMWTNLYFPVIMLLSILGICCSYLDPFIHTARHSLKGTSTFSTT